MTQAIRAAAAIFFVAYGLPLSALAQAPANSNLAMTKSMAAPAPSASAARKAPASAPAGTAVATPAASAVDATPVRVLLAPETETVLLAQTVGRIVSLKGSLGSRVGKGQLVVGMDCSENAAKLKMSQAELASARETYDSKVRLKGLDAAGEVEVALAAAAVSRADGQIEMTKAQIQNCSVYAPFSGRIAKLHVKPFQGVNIGQPLFELVSDGPPRLRLNVPSKWLRSIKVGTAFQVDIEETGKTYSAAITAVNARVDAVAQTIELEAKLTGKPADLLAGMSGTARFSLAP
jgi:membrane fusion protein, multidrug efflux system